MLIFADVARDCPEKPKRGQDRRALPAQKPVRPLPPSKNRSAKVEGETIILTRENFCAEIMKLDEDDRASVIGDLLEQGFLDGSKLTAIVRTLKIGTMYIPRRRALKIKCNFTMYQSSAEPIIALIDSGVTENFIDYRTVMKFRLGTQKLPQEWKILNVDGTKNQAGLIKHCVHLYIKCGNQQK